MNARPILFSGKMVRALLDGRKSQTRRGLKGSYVRSASGHLHSPEINCAGRWFLRDNLQGGYVALGRCPYGQPGDLLWVRETFNTAEPLFSGPPKVLYQADHASKHMLWEVDRWRPSIHMPRLASRLTLQLTEVRVERVQEISEEDARAEGVEGIGPRQRWTVEKFRELWDSISANKPGYGWSENPWVWCLSFRVIHANVDDVMRNPLGYGMESSA